MDWNKTKTIFIIVFSILNVFLYLLYVNRLTEAQNLQVLGKVTIEESLRMENISYGELPNYEKDSSYLFAEAVTFTDKELESLKNQTFSVEGTKLISKMIDPVSVRNTKGDYNFTEFLSKNVLHGAEYTLWEIDKKHQQALYFQKVDDHPIYFSQDAMLTIYWNSEGKVTGYEQHMFGDFNKFNRKKDLLPPLQAMGSLLSRGYLKADSKVIEWKLGYSTLMKPTETQEFTTTTKQVFAPTWFLHVKLKNGDTEDYFVNADEGKVIEFQHEPSEDDQK
ncbi:two-component system regulatory protein YycI [Filibacter tadaridae]|uniref:Two-component system YycFG regulatory protein n=1 Tax=Filibacter tadaridae TaxID=2483811 RepID=A0A3P5WDQ5_9BACL|nr:two-component system regulatory protein YycI [Filibacter tadaridae]VDC21683.1 Two-component system YycFG regulatory protein [Filibacter tadaridae]